jgi:hypothetical protein
MMAQLIRWLGGLMSNFRQFDRATGFLLPPSLDEWRPPTSVSIITVAELDGGLRIVRAKAGTAHQHR